MLCAIVLLLLGTLMIIFLSRKALPHELQALTIINTNPVIHGVQIVDGPLGGKVTHFLPNEGIDKVLYMQGVVSDLDGCTDISNKNGWSLTLSRVNNEGGSTCSIDGQNCIHAPLSGLTFDACKSLADKDLEYLWAVPVPYFINPTDADSDKYKDDMWSAKLIVKDTLTPPVGLSSTFEVSSVRALTVTPLVDYGVVDAGGLTTEQTLTITNTGNLPISLMVKPGGDMQCSSGGVIPVTQIHISTQQNFDYEAAQSLKTEDTILPLKLTPKTAGESYTNLYLKIKVPQAKSGVSCTGSLMFTAIKPQ